MLLPELSARHASRSRLADGDHDRGSGFVLASSDPTLMSLNLDGIWATGRFLTLVSASQPPSSLAPDEPRKRHLD